MTADTALLVSTFKVGAFECTLSFPRVKGSRVLTAVAEWSPSMPIRLTPAEALQYRDARNQAIEELAARTGLVVAMAD